MTMSQSLRASVSRKDVPRSVMTTHSASIVPTTAICSSDSVGKMVVSVLFPSLLSASLTMAADDMPSES